MFTFISEHKLFNLFVVFDFDGVTVVYDYIVAVWASMKRKNVLVAVITYSHTHKHEKKEQIGPAVRSWLEKEKRTKSNDDNSSSYSSVITEKKPDFSILF